MTDHPEVVYHESLAAVVTLGLPLVKSPEGVNATMELRLALLALETALLKVKVALIRAKLDRAKHSPGLIAEQR